jgi:glutathione S-transferase/GST-like protein
MLTIYHWEPNANSGKLIMAAYEKGVEFESRYIDLLRFEQHEPEEAFTRGPEHSRWG